MWSVLYKHMTMLDMRGCQVQLREDSAKEFVGCINHVEESILISLLLIDLAHGCRHACKALVVHQQVEGLGV